MIIYRRIYKFAEKKVGITEEKAVCFCDYKQLLVKFSEMKERENRIVINS